MGNTENLWCIVSSMSLYFIWGDKICKVKTSRYKIQTYVMLYSECSKMRNKWISEKDFCKNTNMSLVSLRIEFFKMQIHTHTQTSSKQIQI